jgi:hypothetical protein
MIFPGSNITCFTFYIHLWPIYWLPRKLIQNRRFESQLVIATGHRPDSIAMVKLLWKYLPTVVVCNSQDSLKRVIRSLQRSEDSALWCHCITMQCLLPSRWNGLHSSFALSFKVSVITHKIVRCHNLKDHNLNHEYLHELQLQRIGPELQSPSCYNGRFENELFPSVQLKLISTTPEDGTEKYSETSALRMTHLTALVLEILISITLLLSSVSVSETSAYMLKEYLSH